MPWSAPQAAVSRLWSRRWLRRVTYGLVAGATVATVVPWAATRPGVLAWAVGRLDALVREETGLTLQVDRVELHPGSGTLVLHGVRLGGDLLVVDRIEVQADLPSLLGPTRRIHLIKVEHPKVRLTEQGLAALRFKERPARTGPLPAFRLGTFSLSRGELDVPEPLRGLPPLQLQFEARGAGLGPNHARLEVLGAHLAVQAPQRWERGRLEVNAEVSEAELRVHEAYLRLAESQLRLHGRLLPGGTAEAGRVEAHLSGVASLGQAARWAGLPRPLLQGDLDLSGELSGTLRQPSWTFQATGDGLTPSLPALQQGRLEAHASGDRHRIRLDRLLWGSAQGRLEARGTWTPGGPVEVSAEGADLDLGALGQAYHLPELQRTRLRLQAALRHPGTAQMGDGLDHWSGALQASVAQNGKEAGRMDLRLEAGTATLDQLSLGLERLTLEASGSALLGRRGLSRLEGKAAATLGVDQVASALRSWKVTDLDMAGQVQAQARFQWDPRSGFSLDGRGDVEAPRWHGAQADRIGAQVRIRGEALWVDDLRLAKGDGHGHGNIWLTWASTRPGQPQIDMCFNADRLPIHEGLKAADLGDLPLKGLASGTVRLVGPFTEIQMTGSAQVQSSEAYGITIPAASSDFWMDLATLHLRLSDLRLGDRPDLLGRGEAPPEGDLSLQGEADMDFARWTWWVAVQGRVDSQRLSIPGPRFQARADGRLLGPITRPWGPYDLPEGRLDLSRGRLLFGDRSLEGLEGRLLLEGGRLSARLGIAGMPRPLLEAGVQPVGAGLAGMARADFLPESAHTMAFCQRLTEDVLQDLNLSAELTGSWKPLDGFTWTGNLNTLKAQFGAFELSQPTPSKLSGTHAVLNLDTQLEGKGQGPDGQPPAPAARLHFHGTLPLGPGDLALRAQGAADLGHLKEVLDRVLEVDDYSLLHEARVQGMAQYDLLAGGRWSEPTLDGHLSLSKGRMYLRGYQGIEDLQADLAFQGRTLRIDEANPLRGTLANGDLRAFGSATWNLQGLESYAWTAALDQFHLRDVPEGLDLQGSLRATLEGDADSGVLQGRLKADRLSYQSEIKLADLILQSTLGEGGALLGRDLDDPLERIRLDLELDLAAPWAFDTNLLKLEGSTTGPFQVLGTLGHPVPKGSLSFKPGGRLTNIFPAGDMVVDRGLLTFSESRALDPLIDIQGSVTSIPGYSVNLDIRGTLSNLSIIPSSTPSLRQDEIISILINPANASNVGTAAGLSSTQGAISSGLASASSGLITTLAFAPFQEQLRRTLGLDRVNVAVRSTSVGTTETEVTLGKSLNLLGQRSAFVVSHKKSGELAITSGQVEWRFGNYILQLGASRGGSSGLNPSGEIRHTWSPK